MGGYGWFLFINRDMVVLCYLLCGPEESGFFLQKAFIVNCASITKQYSLAQPLISPYPSPSPRPLHLDPTNIIRELQNLPSNTTWLVVAILLVYYNCKKCISPEIQ